MYKAVKRNFFIVNLTLYCFFYAQNLSAQFAPEPDDPNSTAIHKDNSNFSFWANNIDVQRGWQDIADTSIGKTTFGSENYAVGKADNKTISLGDSGIAVVTFPFPIYNVLGFDFAIFENGFAQNGTENNIYFLELAIVEVSENGIDYISFESTSNTDTNTQKGSFESIDCRELNNLAGKYPLNYGTPFDLDELDLDSIISIRITDVVGSLNSVYTTYDSQGNKINDPYPTAFPSGGFDLNAIGALNQPNIDSTIIDDSTTTIFNIQNSSIQIFPNPVYKNQILNIISKEKNNSITIYNIFGNKIYFEEYESHLEIKTTDFSTGIYYIKINKNFSKKILIQ